MRCGANGLIALVAGVVVVTGCSSGPGPGPEPATGATPTTAADKAPADAARLGKLFKSDASARRKRAALARYLVDRGASKTSVDAVLRRTRNGIVMRRGPRGSTTRLAGKGVLPAGARWPSTPGGNPFTFIGVFDFAELPRLDPLPAEGRLALYWNTNWLDAGPGKMDFLAATRAYYLPPGAPSVEVSPPAETYPHREKPLSGRVAPVPGESGRVVEAITGRPERDKVIDAMNDFLTTGPFLHHLLGASLDVQGPAIEEVRHGLSRRGAFSAKSLSRFSADERRSGDWLLLAQIEEDAGLIFADGGVLYFVMLREDLEARRFDRVIGHLQSH